MSRVCVTQNKSKLTALFISFEESSQMEFRRTDAVSLELLSGKRVSYGD
jgi:hypothetical protein